MSATMLGDCVTALTLWPRLMKHKYIFPAVALLFALLTVDAVHAEPIIPHGTAAQRGQAAIGLVAFTVIAFVIGRLRGAKMVPWRVIIWGTILSFIFGAMVLFSPEVLQKVQYVINQLLEFSNAG